MTNKDEALKMAIEITITNNELLNANIYSKIPYAFETWIIGRLRDVGIPVKGFFIFNGVESGILKRTDNFDGSINYKWVAA